MKLIALAGAAATLLATLAAIDASLRQRHARRVIHRIAATSGPAGLSARTVERGRGRGPDIARRDIAGRTAVSTSHTTPPRHRRAQRAAIIDFVDAVSLAVGAGTPLRRAMVDATSADGSHEALRRLCDSVLAASAEQHHAEPHHPDPRHAVSLEAGSYADVPQVSRPDRDPHPRTNDRALDDPALVDPELVALRIVLSTLIDSGAEPVGTLDRVSASVRDSIDLDAEIRSAGAPAMASAAVLSALPVLGVLIIAGIEPATLSWLTGTPIGLALLAWSIAWNVLGWAWMRRVVAGVTR